MRLQSDPTILYGIGGGKTVWSRPIQKSEIAQKTSHNTYQIDGLPPTPICNPGRAAIEAVLNPADTKELYFVADGTGGHVFSETLKDHNANVQKWRAAEKEAKAKAASAGNRRKRRPRPPRPQPATPSPAPSSAPRPTRARLHRRPTLRRTTPSPVGPATGCARLDLNYPAGTGARRQTVIARRRPAAPVSLLGV